MAFLLKLTVCWGFFALLYVLLLRRETFFRANRLYLLGTLAAGILLAFFGDRLQAAAEETGLQVITLPVVSAGFQQAAEVSQQIQFIDYVWFFYIPGVAFMLLRTGWGVVRLVRMAGAGVSESLPGGVRLIRSAKVTTPFSFFKWIFVPADNWENAPDTNIRHMLAHERAHADGWHSLDIMLMECLCALCWFHPLVYWYRRSLRTVHEYLADAEASRLTDKKQYGLLLIWQSQSGMPVAFANHFFQSPLKQRLIMLMKKHSAPARALRYALVLPLTVLFILLFQKAPALARGADEMYAGHSYPPFTIPPANGNNNCEEPPAYPGGMEALADFLGKNLKYPAPVNGAYSEGTVYVSFVIKENGTVNNVHVSVPSKLPAAYEAEALRAVSKMPKWEPGKRECKKAEYTITLPIQFSADTQPVSTAKQAVSEADLETPPQFMGGQDALVKYLADHIKYPAAAKQAKATGTVMVKFIVEQDGSISNVEAHDTNGIQADLVVEAIRVVQNMPKWKPGVANGKIFSVQYVIPIRFELD